MLPDLQALPPGAHVLPQQQVVEGHGTDEVEELPDRLPDQLLVHVVLPHGPMEQAELLQDGLHCDHVSLLRHTGAPLPLASGHGAQDPLCRLVLQHAGHWPGETGHTTFTLRGFC